ncbi:Mov34/MPN/PAD-1 family protein [Pseudoxanthomonas mexicana]
MSTTAWTWRWPALEVDLSVTQEVAAVFRQYRQRRWQHERGGQLFATLDSAEGLTLVTATAPHPADRTSWTWLDLDPMRCKSEICQANARGERLVGYWHTHPQAIPSISSQDIASFQAFSQHNHLFLPCPLAVIVGNADSQAAVRAWSIRQDSLHEAIMID